MYVSLLQKFLSSYNTMIADVICLYRLLPSYVMYFMCLMLSEICIAIFCKLLLKYDVFTNLIVISG